MSLTSSFIIGRTALNASQLAIQVAGDNLANAATRGYHRRVASMSPMSGSVGADGLYRGRGVSVSSISRAMDTAIQARLRSAVSQQEASVVSRDLLDQVGTVFNSLSDSGLNNQLGEFFDAFSELANNPSAAETRTLIIENGAALANVVRRMRSDLLELRTQADQQLDTVVGQANAILEEISSLNGQIARTEQGGGEDAGLRDRRESLLEDLSGMIDISIVEDPNGVVDVFVGSTPIVLGGQARPLEVQTFDDNGATGKRLILGDDGQKLSPTSGRIGAILAERDGAVQQAIDDLDSLASNLIFEVNRLHSSGRTFPGMTNTTGTQRVGAADQPLAFNDPANVTLANLPFAPVSGGFDITVTDAATGLTQSVRIDVDLDGIDAAGAPGFADDTSMEDIRDAINAVSGMNAQITAEGRLRIWSDPGTEFGFADDTSGVLAVLGVNTFFEGQDASDIDVRNELRTNPLLLSTGAQEGSNEIALAIAGLRDAATPALGNLSLTAFWQRTTDRVAVQGGAAAAQLGASSQVRANLQAQQSAVSGVSIDEESINLITFQRQFQAAAQFISTVDELTQTLIGLV